MVDVTEKISAALLPVIQSRIMLPVNPENPPSGFKQGKFMVFIGGGNGSGKTVINNLLFDELEEEGYSRNYVAEFGSSIFDDILSNRALQIARTRIEGFLHSAASSDEDHPPGFLKKVALKAFTIARTKAMDVGAPVVIDYHMHDAAFVKDCIEDARKHGYECIMLSPHVDAEKIFSRIEGRFKRTGRPYKLDKILTRHRQFAENIDDYLGMFDLSIILDNNTENSPPSVVAISHNGETTVFNQGVYDHARRKANLNTSATSAKDIWNGNIKQNPPENYQPKPRTLGMLAEKGNAAGEKSSHGSYVRMIEEYVQSKLSR
jgi:predicted ABC-type ATPase